MKNSPVISPLLRIDIFNIIITIDNNMTYSYLIKKNVGLFRNIILIGAHFFLPCSILYLIMKIRYKYIH